MMAKHEYRYIDDDAVEFIIESPKHGEHKVLVDAEDWPIVRKYRWHVLKQDPELWYVANSVPKSDLPEGVRRRLQLLHSLINKTPKGMQTDHTSGDTLDNRKCNLRSVTSGENQMNRGKYYIDGRFKSHLRSKYTGVYSQPRSQTNPWQAQRISVVVKDNGLKRYIGSFPTQETAAEARDRDTVKHITRDKITPRMLNFPEKLEEYLAEIGMEGG